MPSGHINWWSGAGSSMQERFLVGGKQQDRQNAGPVCVPLCCPFAPSLTTFQANLPDMKCDVSSLKSSWCRMWNHLKRTNPPQILSFNVYSCHSTAILETISRSSFFCFCRSWTKKARAKNALHCHLRSCQDLKISHTSCPRFKTDSLCSLFLLTVTFWTIKSGWRSTLSPLQVCNSLGEGIFKLLQHCCFRSQLSLGTRKMSMFPSSKNRVAIHRASQQIVRITPPHLEITPSIGWASTIRSIRFCHCDVQSLLVVASQLWIPCMVCFTPSWMSSGSSCITPFYGYYSILTTLRFCYSIGWKVDDKHHENSTGTPMTGCEIKIGSKTYV